MNAIVYLTFNGVYNCTNGICTQTKTVLTSIKEHYKQYSSIFGQFHFHIICPKRPKNISANEHLTLAYEVTNNTGGTITEIDYEYDKFWSLESWTNLSWKASKEIIDLSIRYESIFAICVDAPFLHTPLNIESNLKGRSNIISLIALYSSSYIHDKHQLDLKRLSWEYIGIASARLHDNIFLGNISNSMTNHLISHYGADKTKFIPFASSINIEHNDFIPISSDTLREILLKYKIPQDKDIILSFGRADWIKGFDILLTQLNLIKSDCHLVLIVVPYDTLGETEIIDTYKKIIQQNKVECSLFVGFNRELPIALCQFEKTKAVVIPSRGEPFSNIPFEVSLWAKENGPVCLASNLDSFMEQIDHESNGFIFDLNSSTDLSSKLESILKLVPQKSVQIRRKAYSKVIEERDFVRNFSITLDCVKNKLK